MLEQHDTGVFCDDIRFIALWQAGRLWAHCCLSQVVLYFTCGSAFERCPVIFTISRPGSRSFRGAGERGIITTFRALEESLLKLPSAPVAYSCSHGGLMLLPPAMTSKPFGCVRYRTVCGLSVPNTQVKRESYASYKDKKFEGFSFLSHSGRRAATWHIN